MKPVLAMVPLFLAEFIGTAMLLFLGCAGCLHWSGPPPSLLQIGLNFGLVVMLIIQIFGCVSGGHLNPVVTIAAFLCGIVSLPKAAVYVAGQTLGAFAGFGLLCVLTPQRVLEKSASVGGGGHCMVRPNPEMWLGHSLAVEYVATTCLVLICCGVWDKRNAQVMDSVALKFGLALTALVVILVSLCDYYSYQAVNYTKLYWCSVNRPPSEPARIPCGPSRRLSGTEI